MVFCTSLRYIFEIFGYVAQVIAAAGGVDHSQLVDLTERAFSKVPSSGVSVKELIDQVCSHAAADWADMFTRAGRMQHSLH